MNIIIFAPHPDDDILGCGGSIAKWKNAGHEVSIVYMTSGDSGDLQFSKEEYGKLREKEAIAAASALGVADVFFLRISDGYVEYNPEVLNRLVELIREKKPEVVCLPHDDDAHRDHKNTYILVKEAINRASANSYQECKGAPWEVSTILCYEVWTPLREITYSEDISEYIDIKINAMKKHTSQLKNLQYDEAIKGLNRYRGIMTGKGSYAECFYVLKIKNIFAGM